MAATAQRVLLFSSFQRRGLDLAEKLGPASLMALCPADYLSCAQPGALCSVDWGGS